MPKLRSFHSYLSHRKVLVLGIVIICLLAIHTRGFIAHDEGWVVNPAYRMLNGETPYKDFHFIYFPGSLFLTAGILSIWESILALRLVAVAFSLVSLLLVYKITFSVSKNRIISLLSAVLYFILGPATVNYLAPTQLAFCMGLATIYLLFIAKLSRKTVILSGITACLALLFKQNFGVAVLISSLIGIYFSYPQKRINTYKNFFLGFFAVILATAITLLAMGALQHFINDMYYFALDKAPGHWLRSDFIAPDTLIKQLLKIILYTLPFTLSAVAIFLAIKKNKKLLFLPVFVLVLYVFGIRPTTDYIHLAPLLSITGFSLVTIYVLAKKSAKVPIYIVLLSLILIGFITVGFRHYYRWDAPLKDHKTFLSNPRVLIFGNGMAEKTVKQTEKIISENKRQNNYLFLYDYMPMHYFVTDSRNPTRFDFIPPLTSTEEDEIISGLIRTNTQIIVSYSDLQGDNSKISKFIRSNYIMKEYPPFFAWIKN